MDRRYHRTLCPCCPRHTPRSPPWTGLHNRPPCPTSCPKIRLCPTGIRVLIFGQSGHPTFGTGLQPGTTPTCLRTGIAQVSRMHVQLQQRQQQSHVHPKQCAQNGMQTRKQVHASGHNQQQHLVLRDEFKVFLIRELTEWLKNYHNQNSRPSPPLQLHWCSQQEGSRERALSARHRASDWASGRD